MFGPVTAAAATPNDEIVKSCKHLPYGAIGEPDKVLCREGYAVGYDNDVKNPACAAYVITKGGLEDKVKRSNKFKEDKDIGKDYRSILSDYKNSGYDRGHMAPAASVSFNTSSMQELFFFLI